MGLPAKIRELDPWARLILALVLVAAAALALRFAPPLAVFLVFVVGTIWVSRVLTTRARRQAAQAPVVALGLQRSETDPFGLLGYPFALFRRGGEPRIGAVLYGGWQGMDVKAFECTRSSGDEPAGPPPFSCAIVPLGSTASHVAIEPESFVAMLADRVELARVATGSEELDRRFEVRAEDDAFAISLLDEPMRAWLLGLEDRWGFEVNGRLLLAYGPQVGTSMPVEVLEAARGFVARLPEAIRPSPEPPPSPAAAEETEARPGD